MGVFWGTIYQRETVDRGLKQIMGPDFIPWAQRYEGWEDT